MSFVHSLYESLLVNVVHIWWLEMVADDTVVMAVCVYVGGGLTSSEGISG